MTDKLVPINNTKAIAEFRGNPPAPTAQPLTDEWLSRHALLAADCPPASAVILLSSIKRVTAAQPGVEPLQGGMDNAELLAAWKKKLPGVEPSDAPLKPSKTVKAFTACIAGECNVLMADGHYRESIAEHLEEQGMSFVPAPTTPSDTYVRARMLLREQRIIVHKRNLPDGVAERLLKQLREVQGRPTAGGGMSIVHPKWSAGGHGDLAAAFVLAVWQLSGERVEPPPPEPGTKEWETAAKKERFERFRREEENPYWAAKGGSPDRGAGAFWKRGR